MKSRIGMAGGVCAFAAALVLSAAPASQAATPTISGSVTCANSQPVEGVWVQSSGNGSEFASWKATGTATASFSASLSTSLPADISLHVGCGGSTKKWTADDFSPALAGVDGSTSISVTDCINGHCAFALAYGAAQWALSHTVVGHGANHALPTDKTYSDPGTGPYISWAGLCLEFAASAYLNAGAGPNPVVLGENATAHEMYETYKSAGLIQTTWISSSGTQTYPPDGALVFYPGMDVVNGTTYGHIAISTGDGNVVSANGYGNPLVRQQNYDTGNLAGYYKGWAFPKNAGS